jgi:APA family basic amino acid/polyamine antiporter
LYPVLPLLFVLTVLGVIVATAIHSPGDAGMSLVLILVGVPVYYAWRAWQRRSA